ncbi:MAG: CHAP domain-containing protein [Solirubrobacteraceae bacterium]|nr:CHAP domain-containing protein [Solirubrobacteraceae bacterium]
MSVEAVISRISELQQALEPKRANAHSGNFAQQLTQATTASTPAALTAAPVGAQPLSAVAAPAAGGVGAKMVALAQAEIGQAEQPPGSNDSPRIAEYRTATAGSGVGPWCNFFVSYIAKQAGAPLGEAGQGFGLVDATYAWAQRTGRANPVGSGKPPQPGDLIVWDEHIGLVEQVLPDGKIQTIEGNSSNQVIRRVHDAKGDGALGFVNMNGQS